MSQYLYFHANMVIFGFFLTTIKNEFYLVFLIVFRRKFIYFAMIVAANDFMINSLLAIPSITWWFGSDPAQYFIVSYRKIRELWKSKWISKANQATVNYWVTSQFSLVFSYYLMKYSRCSGSKWIFFIRLTRTEYWFNFDQTPKFEKFNAVLRP